LINKKHEKYRRGKPFDLPQNPDELGSLTEWVLERIKLIVVKENLWVKFHNVEQLLAILHAAAENKQVNLEFDWDDGEWLLYLVWGFYWTNWIIKNLAPNYWESCDFEKVLLTTKYDILNLPIVIKEFGRIYRHKSKNYRKGKQENLLALFGDVNNG
jgi:hypothetical protein